MDVSETPGVPPNHHTIFKDVEDSWDFVLMMLIRPAFAKEGRMRDGEVKALAPNLVKTRLRHKKLFILVFFKELVGDEGRAEEL